MKTEHGFKKTRHSLLKKASSLIIAGLMAVSALPAAVSAADDEADSKFWQTIVDLNMDGFENLRSMDAITDSATVDGRTYGVNFCWGTNGKRNANSKAKKNGEDDEVSAAYAAGVPDGVGEYVLKHHGACTADNGWRWTSSDSGWAFSNLWDADTVAVGDTVRVTAQVYPVASGMKKQKYNEGKGIFEPEGGLSGGKGEMRLMSGDKISMTEVTGDQWNELALEFELTAENVANGKVQVDSGVPAADAVYVSRWVVGSIKVQVLGDANGSYTIQDGTKWEQMNLVTMDDYEAIGEGIGGGISYWSGKKSDNTGYLKANAGNGKYAEFKTNMNAQRIHQGTGLRPIKDEGGVTAPAIPGAGAITNVFKLNRAWSMQQGSWNAGMGKGAPDSYINISGLFDNTNVQVGDTVKITAWVLGASMHDGTTATDSMKPDDPATVTMWLADRARSGDVATNGPAADYNVSVPSVPSETASYDDMKQGEWKEITLTYEVTADNKDVTGISINSDKMGSEKVTAFPLYLYVAAVKAEKLTDDPTQELGRIVGSVNVGGIDAPAEGEDVQVVVVAYRGARFLGCDMVPYTTDGKYEFAIDGASAADKVIAYVWSMNRFQPRMPGITLKAAF